MVAHGGNINVKNKEIGVTFEIFLPIQLTTFESVKTENADNEKEEMI